jgi:hypothetical protein
LDALLSIPLVGSLGLFAAIGVAMYLTRVLGRGLDIDRA